MKIDHPRLLNYRFLTGESWSVINEAYCRNQTALQSKWGKISALAEEFKHSRNTIRKHLETIEEPIYRRQNQPQPKLGVFETQLLAWLEQDVLLPRKQRRTAQRLFECLQVVRLYGYL